jgi:hypothetical protein
MAVVDVISVEVVGDGDVAASVVAGRFEHRGLAAIGLGRGASTALDRGAVAGSPNAAARGPAPTSASLIGRVYQPSSFSFAVES